MAIYRGAGGSGDATNTASNQATTATTKAAEAGSSALAASQSATNAANSATTATTQATNAANSATTATTQATNAANSATTATTQATNAANSATAAASSASTANTQATTATTQAVNAATSATNAATSETNAAAYYDAFDDRYLGSKATAPTLDNDGMALLTGALYWNSTVNQLYVWDGSAWDAAAFNVSGSVTSFSAGTTGLTPSTASAGSITLAGTLAVANGGTGATTAGGARTNLDAQATLVSGANLKTVSGQSLLGSGDVVVTPTTVSDQANTSTGYFDLPAGTTAQRPGTPGSGMLRFNSDAAKFEGYNGTAWSHLGDCAVNVKDFGAVGDGVTDDTAAIQAAVSYAASLGGAVIEFGAKDYAISSTILVQNSNVKLRGAGKDMQHLSGGTGDGPATKFIWTGAAGGTIFSFISPQGATNQKRVGQELSGCFLDGNGLASIGINITSVNELLLSFIHIEGVTQNAIYARCYNTGALADAPDNQRMLFSVVTFNLVSNPASVSANGFNFGGSPTLPGGNTSLNMFQLCQGSTVNGVPLLIDNGDNCVYMRCSFNCAVTGTNAVEIRGNGASGSNHFFNLGAVRTGSGGAAAIRLLGTASGYPNNTTGNSFWVNDSSNGTQPPNADSGCTFTNVQDSGLAHFVKFDSVSVPVSIRTTGGGVGTARNILVDAATQNIIISLPLAATFPAGYSPQIAIKRIDNTANTVTVARQGTDTINGATSETLAIAQGKTYICDPATNAWYSF